MRAGFLYIQDLNLARPDPTSWVFLFVARMPLTSFCHLLGKTGNVIQVVSMEQSCLVLKLFSCWRFKSLVVFFFFSVAVCSACHLGP